jgi:hypothetical protein
MDPRSNAIHVFIENRILMYTQDEIKSEVAKHKRKISELRAVYEGDVGIERAHIKKYQAFCKHPNGYRTSCMGDTGYHCPDCDYGY